MNDLSHDEQRRAEELLDMFVTPSWSHIVEDFTEVREGLDTLQGVETEQQLHRNKGKIDVLNILLSYEDTVRRILDDAETV